MLSETASISINTAAAETARFTTRLFCSIPFSFTSSSSVHPATQAITLSISLSASDIIFRISFPSARISMSLSFISGISFMEAGNEVSGSPLISIGNTWSALPSSMNVATSLSTHSDDGVSVEHTTTRQSVEWRALSIVSVSILLTGSSSVSLKARRTPCIPFSRKDAGRR